MLTEKDIVRAKEQLVKEITLVLQKEEISSVVISQVNKVVEDKANLLIDKLTHVWWR